MLRQAGAGMTTIAWDGVTLAADRQTSYAGSVYLAASKIHKIPGGYIACCGEYAKFDPFLNWARKGMKGKPPTEDMAAILIKGGKAFWVEDGAIFPVEAGKKLALGTGWKWAAAAMDFGQDAVEAVAYACTRDNSSGGGVDHVRPIGATVKATRTRK